MLIMCIPPVLEVFRKAMQGNRQAIIVVVLPLAGLGAMFVRYLESFGLSPESVFFEYSWLFSSVAASMLTALAVADRFNRIAGTQAKAEADLETAHEVQETLLSELSNVPQIDVANYYRSAEKTGGDWYGHYFDKHRSLVYICCGDVVGHGIGSALITGVATGGVECILDHYFYKSEKGETYDPQDVIKTLFTHLNTASYNTGTSQKRLMTMAVLIIDITNGDVWQGNAGHAQPLHLGKNQVKVKSLVGNRLGASFDRPDWRVNQFKIQPGDTLICYTDGLLENEGPKGEVLPSRYFRKELPMLYGMSSSKVVSEIIKWGSSSWQTHPPDDDCTLVVCRWVAHA